MSAKSITSAFLDILSETITSVLACRECCLVNPDSDFTRNRSCLDLQMVFKAPFLFADASVTSCLPELLELSKNRWQDIPWDSALTQARAKILPEAYGRVFHLFNEKTKSGHLFNGYTLAAVDGSEQSV